MDVILSEIVVFLANRLIAYSRAKIVVKRLKTEYNFVVEDKKTIDYIALVAMKTNLKNDEIVKHIMDQHTLILVKAPNRTTK